MHENILCKIVVAFSSSSSSFMRLLRKKNDGYFEVLRALFLTTLTSYGFLISSPVFRPRDALSKCWKSLERAASGRVAWLSRVAAAHGGALGARGGSPRPNAPSSWRRRRCFGLYAGCKCNGFFWGGKMLALVINFGGLVLGFIEVDFARLSE